MLQNISFRKTFKKTYGHIKSYESILNHMSVVKELQSWPLAMLFVSHGLVMLQQSNEVNQFPSQLKIGLLR